MNFNQVTGDLTIKTRNPKGLKDGAYCKVVGGTHVGKAGTIRDIRTSKTGHVTLPWFRRMATDSRHSAEMSS